MSEHAYTRDRRQARHLKQATTYVSDEQLTAWRIGGAL